MNFYMFIPYNQLATLTTHPAEDANFPVERITSGNRNDTFKVQTAATTATFVFNYGSAFYSNGFYLGRANLASIAASGNITVTVQASNNSSFSSLLLNESITYNESTGLNLGGVNNEDLLLTFNPVSAQYWRVVLTAATSIYWQFSKLYLGIFSDLGCEPSSPVMTKIINTTAKTARRQIRTTSFKFENVSDSKKNELYSWLLYLSEVFPAIIYFADYKYILDDCEYKFGMIRNIRAQQTLIDKTTITFDFVEAI